MSKKNFQIDIPEPCSKKFVEMTPANGGNFCDSCEKVIVDFTKMTDDEIAKTFIKNKGKLCGQFHKSQLNRKINLIPPAINSTIGKAASLLLSGALIAGGATAQINLTSPPMIENQVVTNSNKEDLISKKRTESTSASPLIFKFKVVDKTEEGLIGANIKLKENSNIGASTDFDGSAILTIPDLTQYKNSVTAIISYTGFTTQEIEINLNYRNPNYVHKVILEEGIILGYPIVVGMVSYRPTTLY